ncbi:hypothetical protein ONZ45_g16161 [Pleurotus djamor]|nr:hypothetical protein ONZ45_g16161 [Pleurotus djamor]
MSTRNVSGPQRVNTCLPVQNLEDVFIGLLGKAALEDAPLHQAAQLNRARKVLKASAGKTPNQDSPDPK